MLVFNGIQRPDAYHRSDIIKVGSEFENFADCPIGLRPLE